MRISDMSDEEAETICCFAEHAISREELEDKIRKYDFEMGYGREIINRPNSQKNLAFFGRHKKSTLHVVLTYAGILAAASILAGFIGHISGPVIADPDTGFFHWLKKDHEAVEFITNPQAKVNGVNPSDISKEELLDLVSEAYYTPDLMPPGMLMNYIKYSPEDENYTAYYTDGKHYVEMGFLPRKGYDAEDKGYEYYGSMFISRNISEYFTKGQESLGTYPFHDRMYYIRGNLDFDEIKEMTIEYAAHLYGIEHPNEE